MRRYINRVLVANLFGFVSVAYLHAQEVKQDSIEIRKDFSLPSPAYYDSYYDAINNVYMLYPKIGNVVTGTPVAMTPEEYSRYVLSNKLSLYYKEKANQNSLVYRKDPGDQLKKSLIPTIRVKNKLFESLFGSNKIELIPQGYASFDLGVLAQKIDNPLILPQNRKSFAIDIQQRIQLGINGKVGENLQLKANYDTQSGFAFENRMNLLWQAKGTWKDLQSKGFESSTGGEDKIIKRMEFGNINMPLSTGLIRGSQSLFGLKTEFQLGKTKGTAVLSQQQGEARQITVQGGGVVNTFKVNAVDYEENQHYYLGQYFYKNYDQALQNYPSISSLINITRLEVWVIEQGAANLQSQKSVLGIRDLGEGLTGYPDNSQSNVYESIKQLPGVRDYNTAYNAIKGQSLPSVDNGMVQNEPYVDGENFVFNRRAKLLKSNEYTYNPQLGYISLNQKLADNQLLAVSFSYTINGSNKVYKVGEFSEESPLLITKLLKPNVSLKTTSPMWKLMMKNIYPLNANQLQQDGFVLNVLYRDPKNGKVNYLPGTSVQDTNLLKLLNWDRLNQNNDVQSNSGQSGANGSGDGIFDYVPGLTVDPQNGKVIFTKAEPFGSYMASALGSNDPNFVFNDLYTMQKQQASQSNLAQRYTLEGRFKGSVGSGISLGAINVPQGSVKVTANGAALIEGQDYTVDYVLGTVNIINESVKNSGQAINISMENQMTFNTQRKRFMGLNLERQVNENLLVGATVVNYSEIPLTQKVQMGSEAVNNTMAGFNLLYNNELPFLTRLTDKIPFINTEAPSKLNFRMEGAYLMPGQNNAMNNQSYIDDFEQTSSKISLKEPALWALASKPEKNQNDPIFQNSGNNDDLTTGYGRGLLSWYNIDPRFYGLGGRAPEGITAQSVSNYASRRVRLTELYNNRDVVAGEQTYINTLDVTYYPTERGPYNLNPMAESPQQRWAGMMRSLNVTNFNQSNIEYVEFWMQDPYADGNNLGADPKLLLHLGNVSEDILKDGKLGYENGLPTPSNAASTTTSNWGIQPSQFPVLYAFASEGADRTAQDLGLDGMDNEQEATKFGISNVNPVTLLNDPASDDFIFPLSTKFQGSMASSVQDRYRYFRGPEGNSASGSMEVSSQTPDAEDINQDYNLDLTEDYNQYTINLQKNQLNVGQNFIVDVKEVNVKFQNGQAGKVKWYLFRVPVAQFDTQAGSHDPSILNNVRFMRMLLTGFDTTSTLRFGTLDLVRSDWRKYTKNFANSINQIEGSVEVDNTHFDVGSVNLEENALGNPPYVMPPGIERQVLTGTTGNQQQNESSLYMKVEGLRDEARGVFKNTALDMRRFNNLKLFVHAENLRDKTSNLTDLNAKFFIRLGSDATDNYYEYEIPLKYTPSTARTPLEIWPQENTIDLAIQELVDAKLRRDQNGIALDQRYRDVDNQKIITKGRPSLGNVTTLILGVRNESSISKDLVLWVNEIRLSGIDDKGGYAGNASLDFNLGDFATVSANASMSSVGFGALDSKPIERSQSANSSFSINTTVNVDKFAPEKAGLKIPLSYSYAQTIEDPKYNPLDSDVELSRDPNAKATKKIVRTFTQQRSISVVNMHKERTNPNAKPKFYDVENISVTGIYNDDYYRDIYTVKNYRQNFKAYVDYNFAFKPWVIKPFDKIVSDTAKSYKYLRWVKEFNFNLLPTRFSFRTDIDRSYSEMQFRNVEALLSGVPGDDFAAIKNRNFYFGWQYNLGFNFTKSLKLDIASATRTLNDNVDVNTMNNRSIFANPFRAGRPVSYNHKVQLNYRLPFEYLPFLDFVRAEAAYGFSYNWSARSTALTQFTDPNGNRVDLGNLAQNTNDKSMTGSVDIPLFLKKFKYFRKIDSIQLGRKRELDSLNNVYTQQQQNPKKNFKFKNHKFKNKLSPIQAMMYALTSIKQVDFNYNENNATALPGVLSSPNFWGYGQNIGGPTYGFLLGSQADIRRIAVERNWLSSSPYMTDAYTQLKNQEIRGNILIQPANDLRVELNFLRNYTRNFMQGGYNVDAVPDNLSQPETIGYQPSFGTDMTTYSHTTWAFATSFKSGNDIFQKMVENAQELSQRLGGASATGYADGYGLSNAYVLVPAFQAAVQGKSVKEMGEPTKAKFPLPNWRISYTGLKNIPIINSKFSKFELLHAYTSTYTATDIQSNIDYYNFQNGAVGASNRDLNNDFLNPFTFSQVAYIESFAPLLGADVTLRNNMQIRVMYNRDRMYLLGLKNATLTEDSSNEYVLGFGYIIKDFKMRLRFKGKERDIKSDINIRGDFSLRDNKTTITNILLADSQVTGGQRILSLKLSADYNVSQNFNIKIFYDQMMSKYKISTAYPLSTTRVGITATFNFGAAR